MKLTVDYLYDSEEEKETDEKPDKKTPKKLETNDMKEFNELINNEEMDLTGNYFKGISNFKGLVQC